MSGQELPKGWESARLGELTRKIGSGATPKGGEQAYKPNGTPLIRSLNVHFDGFRWEGLAYLDDRQAELLRNVEVHTNDVLLNITGASIGRVTIAPSKMNGARVNQHVCIVRPWAGVESNFIRGFLASPTMQGLITDENYGVTRQALTKEMIENFDIPLPPLPEQRRIVEKIEALTARSRRAREALDSLPALIDRYRQSILAAAFRGDLTVDWRERQGTGGPISASELAAMRRHLWEGVAANRQSARQARYPNPDEAAEEAFGLPEDWRWVTVDELCPVVQYGTSAKTSEAGRVTVLRMGNIQSGRLNFDSLKYLPTDHDEFPELLLDRGDVLFNRTNSPELVGKSAVFDGYSSPCSFASYLIRLKVAGLDPRLLAAYINSPFGRSWARGAVSQQVGQANINGSKLKALAVPLPPAAEQKEILRRVAAYEAAVLHLLEQHDTANSRLATLDQSILAKAFRGELVPQDPRDEPASVLLERIRAERAVAGVTPRRGRRGGGKASA